MSKTFSSNLSQNQAEKTISYLRVSTQLQDLEKDKLSILKLAHELQLNHVTFVEEKISGKISWKQRKIAEVIETLQAGDSLLITEISRLGRSLLEIVEILSICSRKQINVYSVKGSWKLDATLQSKVIGTVFALCAEIERSLISQRTIAALQAKKQAGIRLGRPKGTGKSKLDQFEPEIKALLQNGSSKRYIAKRYHSTEANFHHWLKTHGLATTKPFTSTNQ